MSSWSACVPETRVPWGSPNMCRTSVVLLSAGPVTGDRPNFECSHHKSTPSCRTARLRKCHRAFFESVLGISPAGAGEVHERAQLPPSNSHSDTHRQACMAPIDRLMVVGGGTWVAVLRSGPTLTQQTDSEVHGHIGTFLCDKHYKGDL